MNSNKIRLFISSTFSDMHSERNALMNEIFPKLKAKCLESGIEFVAVDLRWGITNEQKNKGEIIPRCLEEIKRSNCFLGMVGDRYGWSPNSDEVKVERFDADFRHEVDLLLEQNKSITEIEFYYGLGTKNNKISNGSENLGHLVLVREPNETYRELHSENYKLREEFIERVDKEYYLKSYKTEFTGFIGRTTPEELNVIKNKLERFNPIKVKANEKALFFSDKYLTQDFLKKADELNLFTFPKFEINEKFETEVFNFVKDLIDTKIAELAKDEMSDGNFAIFETESSVHTLSARYRLNYYINREKVERELRDKIQTDIVISDSESNINPNRAIAVRGESGSGKSSMLASQYLQFLNDPGFDVFYRSVGVTNRSLEVGNIIDDVIEYLLLLLKSIVNQKDNTSLKTFFEGIKHPDSLKEKITLMEELMNKYSIHSEKNLIIIVDAINQFRAIKQQNNIDWIPKTLPANINVIFSYIDDKILTDDDLSRFDMKLVEVDLFDKNEANDLIQAYLEQAGKDFDADQKTLVNNYLEKNKHNLLPLQVFILTVLISKIPYYEVLDPELKEITQLNPKETIQKYLVHTLSEIINDREFVEMMLLSLTLSVHGLSESQLKDVLKLKFTDLYESENEKMITREDSRVNNNWSISYGYLAEFLRSSNDGRTENLYFIHPLFSETILDSKDQFETETGFVYKAMQVVSSEYCLKQKNIKKISDFTYSSLIYAFKASNLDINYFLDFLSKFWNDLKTNKSTVYAGQDLDKMITLLYEYLLSEEELSGFLKMCNNIDADDAQEYAETLKSFITYSIKFKINKEMTAKQESEFWNSLKHINDELIKDEEYPSVYQDKLIKVKIENNFLVSRCELNVKRQHVQMFEDLMAEIKSLVEATPADSDELENETQYIKDAITVNYANVKNKVEGKYTNGSIKLLQQIVSADKIRQKLEKENFTKLLEQHSKMLIKAYVQLTSMQRAPEVSTDTLEKRNYEQVIKFRGRLEDKNPESLQLKIDLASAYNNLAQVQRQLGIAELKEITVENSKEYLFSFFDRISTEIPLKDCSIETFISGVEGMEVDSILIEYTQCLKNHCTALQMRDNLIKNNTSNIRLKRDKAQSLNNIGMAIRLMADEYLEVDNSKEIYLIALKFIKESLEIRQRVYERDAYSTDIITDYANANNNLAALCWKIGKDPEQYLEETTDKRKLINKLYNNNNLDERLKLVQAVANMGRYYFDSDLDKSIECYRECNELLNACKDKIDSDNPMLINIYRDLGLTALAKSIITGNKTLGEFKENFKNSVNLKNEFSGNDEKIPVENYLVELGLVVAECGKSLEDLKMEDINLDEPPCFMENSKWFTYGRGGQDEKGFYYKV